MVSSSINGKHSFIFVAAIYSAFLKSTIELTDFCLNKQHFCLLKKLEVQWSRKKDMTKSMPKQNIVISFNQIFSLFLKEAVSIDNASGNFSRK